jgi:D-sedoheptulose 7-phosphate isomerase
MSDRDTFIRAQLAASASLKQETAATALSQIGEAAQRLIAALRGGRKVLLCGNGGSAADCQHIAAELVSALHHDRPRKALPAIALTTDTSFLTANANDFGFEHVFARQIEALGQPGDILLAISTSGNSVNVLRALETATARGLDSILFTGKAGGKAAALAQVAIRVPSGETQRIQETHITIGHILCELVERELFR